jgi:hypothetical protein
MFVDKSTQVNYAWERVSLYRDRKINEIFLNSR